jgi:hypothetical protein
MQKRIPKTRKLVKASILLDYRGNCSFWCGVKTLFYR